MGVGHLAIILDGNRRYAEKRGLPRLLGHKHGSETIRKLLKWASELSEEEKKKYWVDELSLFIFSMQNFDRSDEEKQLLFGLFAQAFDELYKSKDVEKLQVKVDFLGRLHLLPKSVQDSIRRVKEKTKGFKKCKLNFCIAYGGREEIVDAVNKIIKENRTAPITEEDFGKHLYTNDDVDIVIRTSGEYRTSNYLIWQSNYAEWFFLDKTWPEFTPKDFMQVIDDYNKRERRFGK